ncbi:MAG: M1 family metallopeptidase, partial [Bacteroidota bacterium]
MTVTPEANGVIEEVSDVVMAPEIPNELPVYRATYKRTHDLLHTKLDLRFDWPREQVIGTATLTLTPLFSPSNQLVLDAKGFDFKSIKTASDQTLSYDYGGEKQQVTIALDREYKRGEEYTLVIDYVATPEQSGGSSAITSDKGLFFINPRGEEGDKPQQIWTQGETENNSRWFPTIDKPNERCTQEMYVTVEDRFKVLSNGTLMEEKTNGDGTTTFYWKMDLPHAPYLFMLAIGEFDVVEDEKWNGIPVNYWMEKGWKDHAKDIYPYTPEMLTFFSDVTGVKYPWPKYSQVAVRDYVSGAMENTSAVIFGEFMHGTKRDLIDVETNEKIVAHEMFHHWFGDYVTCESWSNLTLNEGFANYSEYLW